MALVLPTYVLAEGSEQLGLGLGLGEQTVVHIQIDAETETIRFCTSDDGIQSNPIVEIEQDLDPGGFANRDTRRSLSDVVLYPPTSRDCSSNQQCELGQLCMASSEGLPVSESFDTEQTGECGYTFAVAPTADPSLGVCAGPDGARRYHSFTTTEAGVWRMDMVGERETLGAPLASTRFFDIEVLDSAGLIVSAPRVFSYQWFLVNHSNEQTAPVTLFPRRRVAGEPYWYALTLDGVRDYDFGLLANSSGIAESEGRSSTCQQVVDNRLSPPCPLAFEGRRATLFAQSPIFLRPTNALEPAPNFRISDLNIQDEAGTGSISPNADGIQDSFIISFNASTPGTLRLWIDIDLDGTASLSDELVLKREFQSGPQELIWDGTDGNGARLGDGAFPFSAHFSFGELHVIGIGAESLDGNLDLQSLHTDNSPMYWDDQSVHRMTNAQRISSPWNANAIRTWEEEGYPLEDRPALYATWTLIDERILTEAGCRRCPEAQTTLLIGPDDDSPDSDEDGLADDEEDANQNGVIDPGETDPNNPDTDGDGLDDKTETDGEPSPVRADTDQDGLNDGIEDESGDGFFQTGETDPTNPDTDGDGLFDGTEDANGNGRVDNGETDPRTPDTDGDGLLDGEDPFPLEGQMESTSADAIIQLNTSDAGSDAFGLDQESMSDRRNTERYGEESLFGCNCETHSTHPSAYFWLILLCVFARVTPRRKTID